MEAFWILVPFGTDNLVALFILLNMCEVINQNIRVSYLDPDHFGSAMKSKCDHVYQYIKVDHPLCFRDLWQLRVELSHFSSTLLSSCDCTSSLTLTACPSKTFSYLPLHVLTSSSSPLSSTFVFPPPDSSFVPPLCSSMGTFTAGELEQQAEKRVQEQQEFEKEHELSELERIHEMKVKQLNER